MWAEAKVQAHPYGPEAGCHGGDDCDHQVSVGVGLGFGKPNEVDEDASYADRLRQTLDNLIESDSRVRDGHYYSVKIC